MGKSLDDTQWIKLQTNTNNAPTFSCDVESIEQQLGQRARLFLVELVVPLEFSQGQRLDSIDHLDHPLYP
jgi:hypothetical protein